MSTPEERYDKVEKKTLQNGKIVYRSLRPKIIRGNPVTDIILVAGEQDRADIIAKNVYGSPTKWWKIAAANRNVNGSLHMSPNTDVIIPK